LASTSAIYDAPYDGNGDGSSSYDGNGNGNGSPVSSSPSMHAAKCNQHLGGLGLSLECASTVTKLATYLEIALLSQDRIKEILEERNPTEKEREVD